MTAKLTELLITQDNSELVRDKIAAILVDESAAQMVLALASETVPLVTYTRVGSSDYTATAALSILQYGSFVVTAGTLTAGVGQWTCVAPDGTSEQFTTSAADDAIVFTGFGLTLTVVAGDTKFETGDVIAATAYDQLQYKLRVFTERSNPWAEYAAGPEQGSAAAAPIVAVAFKSESYDKSSSNVVKRQRADGVFEIDCYGYGKSTATTGGHDPGDARASVEAQRAKRLVRQILMAATYTYLDMQGVVGGRFPDGSERFPPDIEAFPPNVTAWRFTLRVGYNEFSPQVSGEACAIITSTHYRTETGEVLINYRVDF